jgi:hypothetical protein
VDDGVARRLCGYLGTSACHACEEGSNMTVVIYGPAYSTCTRTARLALKEKGIAYRLQEVDALGGEGQ